MPELPEVECLKNGLAGELEGSLVCYSHFFRHDIRDPIPIQEIENIFLNQTIKKIERRGKYLILNTSKGAVLIHLGMTGHLFITKNKKPEKLHTHWSFEIKNANKEKKFIHFSDPRRFGRIGAWPKHKKHSCCEHSWLSKLGPEPLEVKNLGEHLFKKLHSSSANIKNLLLNAENLVGVGNIYASEALFLAKIHPQKTGQELKRSLYIRLANAIRFVLQQAISLGGTSFRDYLHHDGSKGDNVSRLQVYDREGKPCFKCGEPIQNITISGRSTYLCSVCQKI